MSSLLLVTLKGFILIIIGFLVIIILLTFLFLKLAPTFGAKPDDETLARIKASPNFNGKTFVNLVPTQASTLNADLIIDTNSSAKPRIKSKTRSKIKPRGKDGAQNNHILTQFLFPPKGKNPETPIKTEPLNLIAHSAPAPDKNNATSSKTSAKYLATTLTDGEFVWLGHSTVLFKIAGKTLITDPLFHRASPVPLGGKPFAMTHPPKASDLPYIDIVLISHDHYDHLDHKAIQQIKDKTGHFYVPLGVKAHLVRWGVSAKNISEYDWYESAVICTNTIADIQHTAAADSTIYKNSQDNADSNLDQNIDNNLVKNITVTFTPARHFSGRSITGQRTTLWGSWVVQSADLTVFFSGDGGYSKEFAKIGARFGGFDVAFIEDGAYNERWQDVHMLPEDSAQAGIDVGAKIILPIHWGKFDLSTHHWREPVQRIKSAVNAHNTDKADVDKIALATPRIGQVFDLHNLPMSSWWEDEG